MTVTVTAVRMTAALVLLAALGGCASNSYCGRVQPYDNARSVPALKGTADLTIPQSATAMKVPDGTTDDAPFGVKVPDPKRPGKTRLQCLDQPPPLKGVPEDTKPAA